MIGALNRLGRAVRKVLSQYSVGTKEPGLAFDFTQNRYSTVGGTQALSSALTHVRNGNATMTDGYGPELVTNGTFETDAGWYLNGFTISNGVLQKVSGTPNNQTALFPASIVSGKTYAIEFDYTDNGTNLWVGFSTSTTGSALNAGYVVIPEGSGRKAVYVTATAAGASVGFLGMSAYTGIVDNVSVREMPVIKWAPHNLLTYSEDFSNAAWGKASDGTGSIPVVTPNQGVAPDGTLTADRIEFDQGAGTGNNDYSLVVQSPSLSNALRNVALWMKSNTGSDQVIVAYNSGNSVGDEFTVTSEWQLFTLDKATSYSNSNFAAGDSSLVFGLRGGAGNQYFNGTNTPQSADILVWGAHLYRSDLGGMVDNPDRGDSYVPTTSSAVYLPRIGHHEYNGYEWVNKGLLAESESRTNVISDSNSFTAATGTVSQNEVGLDGSVSAWTLENPNSNAARVDKNVTVLTSTTYTASVFAKQGTTEFFYISLVSFTTPANGNVWFDLLNGTVGTESTGITGSIKSCGDGWYRCSVTFTTDASDTSGQIRISVSKGNGQTTADIGDNVIIYGAQFEEGSVPSSYIPTSGSTVSRAAETFTVPSANLPWPTPEVIGPELVTNGTFDTDVSNWTGKTPATVTLSYDAGRLRVVSTDQYNGAYQDITTVVGGIYSFTRTVEGGTGVLRFRTFAGPVGSLVDLGGISTIDNGAGSTETFIFVATSTTTRIQLQSWNTIADFYLDNISVREINPLSVSIQMKGEMDYADTGNVAFVTWSLDGNNLIQTVLQDAIPRLRFRQAVAAVFDDVLQAPPQYSPGLNVPFDIASRHGSTFINGAVDGVALTANTTPTALPDLSSTDLSLAYDYMGTISEFRVWDQDLGDSGIEEASEPSTEATLSLTFDGQSSSFTDTGYLP